jgi:hypothetical protein
MRRQQPFDVAPAAENSSCLLMMIVIAQGHADVLNKSEEGSNEQT